MMRVESEGQVPVLAPGEAMAGAACGLVEEARINADRTTEKDVVTGARLLHVTATVVVAALIAAVLALAGPMPANAADGGAEAQFVARINSTRASKGLGPLAVDGELRDIARGWTDHMVANGGISHNPNYSSQVSANWRKLGENVAVGADFDTVWNAFVSSSAHYKNIVDPAYNYIGVGVSYAADGRMFTTHDFMAKADAAPPPQPRLAPPAPVAPAVPDSPPDPPPAPEPAPPIPPVDQMRMHTVLAALRAIAD
jgi:uncharacterized protein YkwD